MKHSGRGGKGGRVRFWAEWVVPPWPAWLLEFRKIKKNLQPFWISGFPGLATRAGPQGSRTGAQGSRIGSQQGPELQNACVLQGFLAILHAKRLRFVRFFGHFGMQFASKITENRRESMDVGVNGYQKSSKSRNPESRIQKQ